MGSKWAGGARHLAPATPPATGLPLPFKDERQAWVPFSKEAEAQWGWAETTPVLICPSALPMWKGTEITPRTAFFPSLFTIPRYNRQFWQFCVFFKVQNYSEHRTEFYRRSTITESETLPLTHHRVHYYNILKGKVNQVKYSPTGKFPQILLRFLEMMRYVKYQTCC